MKTSDHKVFSILLHETASAWRNKLDKRLEPLGLSQAKWRTLLHLSLAEHALTQRELASRMGIEGATLVGLLDRLAKDGWIVRKGVLNDRRSKTVHLTPKAQTTLIEIHKKADTLRNELLASVSKQELNICIKVLQHIKQSAED